MERGERRLREEELRREPPHAMRRCWPQILAMVTLATPIIGSAPLTNVSLAIALTLVTVSIAMVTLVMAPLTAVTLATAVTLVMVTLATVTKQC